jgi:hypothetical protein
MQASFFFLVYGLEYDKIFRSDVFDVFFPALVGVFFPG